MASNPELGFDEVLERLDEIVDVVRSKDTPLERSLDLLEEALARGLDAMGLMEQTRAPMPDEAPAARTD